MRNTAHFCVILAIVGFYSVSALAVGSVGQDVKPKSVLLIPNRSIDTAKPADSGKPSVPRPEPAKVEEPTKVQEPTKAPEPTIEPTKVTPTPENPTKDPTPTIVPTKPSEVPVESVLQSPLVPLTPVPPTEPLKSVEIVSEHDDKQRMNFFSLFKSARPEDEEVPVLAPAGDFRAAGSGKNTHVGTHYDNFTSFICYRQSTSRSLAMLIKVLLDREKIAAFLDVEDLSSGYWDEQLDTRLNSAQNLILILSKGSLDPCLNDTKYDDLMHQEIREAVITGKRIIPIFDQYDFPSVDSFSEEIQTALRFQGVDWQHQFTEASLHKLLEYLAEELPPPPAAIKGYKIHATTSHLN